MTKGINIKSGIGAKGWLACGVAGALGGILTILLYAGVPMAGPLGLMAQISGVLGVIGVLILVYDYFR